MSYFTRKDLLRFQAIIILHYLQMKISLLEFQVVVIFRYLQTMSQKYVKEHSLFEITISM